jgi:hypothetical protein
MNDEEQVLRKWYLPEISRKNQLSRNYRVFFAYLSNGKIPAAQTFQFTGMPEI